MDCEWGDCQKKNVQDLHSHLLEHVKLVKDYKCLWKSCNRLNQLQNNKYSFLAHLKCHSKDKPFTCKICNKEFARADALNKHLKRHQVEEQLKNDATNLIYHRDELRSFEYINNKNLLRERQLNLNLIKILKDEILRDKSLDDNWNDYL